MYNTDLYPKDFSYDLSITYNPNYCGYYNYNPNYCGYYNYDPNYYYYNQYAD